jgi:6-phosphogluconolactonase
LRNLLLKIAQFRPFLWGAGSGSGPNDLATAEENDDSFLYVVDAGTGSVGAFHINGDGSLTALVCGGGLPVGHGAQGLAAF